MDDTRRPQTDPEQEPIFETDLEPKLEPEIGEIELGEADSEEAGFIFEEQILNPEPVFAPEPTEEDSAEAPLPPHLPGSRFPIQEASGPDEAPDDADGFQYWRFDADDNYPSALSQPQGSRRLGRTGPFWLMAAAIAAIVLAAVWIGNRGRDTSDGVLARENIQAVAGEPGAAALPGDAVPSTPTAPPPTPTPVLQLRVGQKVMVSNTDGQGIRLRADVGLAAITQDIYLDGRRFEVLSPGSEYTDYPVEKDGYQWYRLRVIDDPADTLVGWTVRDYLVPIDQP